MTEGIAPRWRRRKDARPGEILAAALAVFAECGYAAARLDDIAARAGVSKAALYLYFPTKADLFRAVAGEAAGPNLALVQAAENYDGSFEHIVRVLVPTLARGASNPSIGALIKIVIGESRNFPELARAWHDALVSQALGAMSGLIAKAQARGEIKSGDARIFAISLISPLLMAVIWRETFTPVGAPTFDLDLVAAQHLETALGGMLCEPVA